MQKITPNLWFDDDAAETVERYTDVFDDSSVGDVSSYDEIMAEAAGRPEGSVMTVEFELARRSSR